jgi:[acyl-carrier-protein] S-malonyltransferase
MAKKLFDAADSIRQGTSDLCFNGSSEQLSLTINTQPALYTVDLACAAALNDMGITADLTAGFSLGEIAANAYTGIFSFEEGFKLVCRRAEFMNICAEKNAGFMVAVLKLSNTKVEEISANFKNIYPANYNSAGQVSVACGADELDDFIKLVTENGGKAIKLAVSGAFHSPFMSEASHMFALELDKYNLSFPHTPVYSNITAKPYEDNIASLIAKQIMSPVRWEDTILNMISDGADTFIEVGAGKVLSGLIKRISKDVKVYNAEKIEDINDTVYKLKGNNF